MPLSRMSKIGVGNVGQRILFLAQYPRRHHLIDGAKETIRRYLFWHFAAKFSPRLAIANRLSHQIEILHQMLMRELGQETACFAATPSGRPRRGCGSIPAPPDADRPAAVDVRSGSATFFNFGARCAHESVERGVDRCRQYFVFVLEVKVDRAIRYIGPVGYVGDARHKEPLFGKHRYRCVEDALIFFGAPVPRCSPA